MFHGGAFKTVVLDPIPGWIRNAYGVLVPSTALHFDQGYAWDGVKQVPFNVLAACARSTEETTLLPSSPAGKAYRVIPANTLVIDPDNGCQIFQASAGNSFVLPMAPADQTIDLLAGTYTFWVNGLTYCDIAAGTAVGTGFGRCVTGTPVTIVITVGGTVTCTVGIAGQLMAAQLEPGTFGTPFMRVAGTPRSADVVTLIGAALATAIASANSGSAVVSADFAASGTTRYLFSVGDGTGNNRLGLTFSTADKGGIITTAGGTASSSASYSAVISSSSKAGMSWSVGVKQTGAMNGVATANIGTAVYAAPAITKANIGSYIVNNLSQTNAAIKRVTVFSRTLSDSQLAVVTAP